MRKHNKIVIPLCLGSILCLLLLCGFRKEDTEKVIPISFIISAEDEKEDYTLVDKVEFELSQETPVLYYSDENVDGNIVLSFREMHSCAVSFDVTIYDGNGEHTYSGGFVNDATIKIALNPGSMCEVRYERGVKDNIDTIEEVVDYARGTMEVFKEDKMV